MPKSKRHAKRRKKVKNKNTSDYAYKIYEYEEEFPNGYTKTNGEGETMLMDKDHNFIRFLTEKEIVNSWHPSTVSHKI